MPDPDPITAQLRALIDEAAQRAVRDEYGPLVERMASYVEEWWQWSHHPPWLMRLASDIRRDFGAK